MFTVVDVGYHIRVTGSSCSRFQSVKCGTYSRTVYFKRNMLEIKDQVNEMLIAAVTASVRDGQETETCRFDLKGQMHTALWAYLTLLSSFSL